MTDRRRQAAQAAEALPELARRAIGELLEQLGLLDARIASYDRETDAQARLCEPARRLMQIRGIGHTTALAIVATVGDAREFKNGRQFAAWIGLVPSQCSTGGKPRLGHISKRGDAHLRSLVVQGALGAAQRRRARGSPVTLDLEAARIVEATTARSLQLRTRMHGSPGRCSPATRSSLHLTKRYLHCEADDVTVKPTPGVPVKRDGRLARPLNERGPGARLSSGPER